MPSLKEVLLLISGYKTYALVALALFLWLGLVYNWWEIGDVDQLFGLLTILGVGTFRSAMAKEK